MKNIKKFEELTNDIYVDASHKLRGLNHDLRSIKMSSFTLKSKLGLLEIMDNKPILIKYSIINDLFYINDISYDDSNKRICYVISNKDMSIILRLCISYQNMIFIYQIYDLFDTEEDYLLLDNDKFYFKNRQDVWRLISNAKKYYEGDKKVLDFLKYININKLYR